MKIQREADRCELCGKYRAIGVTETSAADPEVPQLPDTVNETFICLWCILDAEELLAREMLGEEAVRKTPIIEAAEKGKN